MSNRPTHPTPSNAIAPLEAVASRLVDLMSDGFYMLLLIRNGQHPTSMDAFKDAVGEFLTNMERAAARENIANEDVHAAKYAYCAIVDETVLSSSCDFRDQWQRMPLQLSQFGDQLAGENFFTRLESLRAQGGPRLPSIEVYYLCLLLGFEGKYRLLGGEKLHYLTARLGDEIVYLKGKRTGFAPHWAPPDAIAHVLRRTIPVWAAAAALAVVCLVGYATLHMSLGKYTSEQLSAYQNTVNMPARTASITIRLP